MQGGNKAITGFVLAGGKSSRMGEDKGLISLFGKAMVCNVIENLAPCVDKIILVSNNPYYKIFGYETISDLISNKGPAGGIYTALTRTTTENNFIISCDMPFVCSQMIHHLISHCTGKTVTIAGSKQGIQPLCGIYRKKALPVFYDCLRQGTIKLRNILQMTSHQVIDVRDWETENNGMFRNINTRKDLLQAISTEDF